MLILKKNMNKVYDSAYDFLFPFYVLCIHWVFTCTPACVCYEDVCDVSEIMAS